MSGKKKLTRDGALAIASFVSLIFGGVFALALWEWLPIAIGGGMFLAGSATAAFLDRDGEKS